jgi:hypothetical protein
MIVISPAEMTDALAPGVKRIERKDFLLGDRDAVRVGRSHDSATRSALSRLTVAKQSARFALVG